MRHPRRVPLAQSFLAILVFAFLSSASIVRAELITVDSARDNTLIQVPSLGDQQLSNGRGPNLFVGRNNGMTGPPLRRGLIYFDLAGVIPEGAVITSVSLTMQLTQGGGSTDLIGLHRLFAGWGEGSSFSGGGGGSAAQPPDATWFFSYFDTRLWSTPGGDFASLASASTQVSTLGSYTWASTASLIEDVQRWLDDPTTNFGWLLKGGETQPGNVHGFATREDTGRPGPRLTIEYTTPAIPEPSSLILLAVGAVGAFGIRRHAFRARRSSR